MKKNDEINKKCLNNSFTWEIIERHNKTVTDCSKRSGFNKNSSNYHLLTETEKYTARIFRLHSDLVTTIEQIQYIVVFIKRTPYKKYLWNNQIDELTYIKYHTEVFTHKVHTICEIMKLLINEIFMLNIPPKDCSWSNISSRLDKKIVPMKIVDNFYNEFKSFIEIRNMNSHRGIYEDTEKDDIELYTGYSLLKYQQILDVEIDKKLSSPKLEFLRRFRIEEHREKRLKLISTSLESIFSHIKGFLESLNIEYKKNLAKSGTT